MKMSNNKHTNYDGYGDGYHNIGDGGLGLPSKACIGVLCLASLAFYKNTVVQPLVTVISAHFQTATHDVGQSEESRQIHSNKPVLEMR